MPPTASLHYHSRDASQQVTITQTATAALDQYEWLVWEERDTVLVAGPDEPQGLEPGYARVERDGTRATLSSAELPRERLVALARRSACLAGPEPPETAEALPASLRPALQQRLLDREALRRGRLDRRSRAAGTGSTRRSACRIWATTAARVGVFPAAFSSFTVS